MYQDKEGREPFAEWFQGLRDAEGKARIETRLQRVAAGLYGDWASVGQGVKELRMLFGPGYRVYFGEDGENIVLLLCAGDKRTQKDDIKTAQGYWKEYKSHGEETNL